MTTFGTSYYSKYADDLISSATSKAKAAARNEVNKSESASFDSQGASISLGDTVKDPTTGELTKEVTFTQKRDTKPETPAPNDKILGMNKYVVIGGALAVVILGGFLVYELTKTKK